MAGLMRKMGRTGALSPRTRFLVADFSPDETLGLPDCCQIEFPDEKNFPQNSARKYRRFVVVFRPKDGVYAGGIFRLHFDYRNVPEYPNKPPKVTILTRIWHPNVDLEGNVCHSYLKTGSIFGENAAWTPLLHCDSLVNGILTIFDTNSQSFNPDDPLNLEAAQQAKTNWDIFAAKAREWTKMYASNGSGMPL